MPNARVDGLRRPEGPARDAPAVDMGMVEGVEARALHRFTCDSNGCMAWIERVGFCFRVCNHISFWLTGKLEVIFVRSVFHGRAALRLLLLGNLLIAFMIMSIVRICIGVLSYPSRPTSSLFIPWNIAYFKLSVWPLADTAVGSTSRSSGLSSLCERLEMTEKRSILPWESS